MNKTALRWKPRLSRPVNLVIALALAALVGALDYATGRELAVSALYLIPVCWACWTAGRGAGFLLTGICSVIWLSADLAAGYHYQYPAIPYWNALMLAALFVAVVYLLSAFQSAHEGLVKRAAASGDAE